MSLNTVLKPVCLYLIIGFLFCFIDAAAQESQLTAEDSAYIQTLSTSYKTRNELFFEAIKNTTDDRKLRKHFEAWYENVFEAVNKRIAEGYFVYKPLISSTVEKVLRDIKDHNPGVPKDVQVLLVREDVPNAYTIGDNSVFINMGLFYYMESEDQVAAIVAHEVGHLILMHSLKALARSYERDKQSIENVKGLRQTDTKKSDRAFELLIKSLYKNGKLTRKYEMQADSLGYELYKNTPYKYVAFLEALELVGGFDSIVRKDLSVEVYKRFFDLPSQPFQEKWLQKEDFSFYNYDAYKPKFDEDSLSSHPTSADRIAYLKTVFPELAKQEVRTEAKTAEGYSGIKNLAERERMSNLFFNEQYGEGIYLALTYLQEDPKNRLYLKWLGRNMQKTYEAKRDYQLNKYIDRVAPNEQSDSYITFLSFMWNLDLDEIKVIADHYNPAKR